MYFKLFLRWRIIARVDNEVFIKIHSKDVTARSLSNWLDENGWQVNEFSIDCNHCYVCELISHVVYS